MCATVPCLPRPFGGAWRRPLLRDQPSATPAINVGSLAGGEIEQGASCNSSPGFRGSPLPLTRSIAAASSDQIAGPTPRQPASRHHRLGPPFLERRIVKICVGRHQHLRRSDDGDAKCAR
jgi:hypothetical protein